MPTLATEPMCTGADYMRLTEQLAAATNKAGLPIRCLFIAHHMIGSQNRIESISTRDAVAIVTRKDRTITEVLDQMVELILVVNSDHITDTVALIRTLTEATR